MRSWFSVKEGFPPVSLTRSNIKYDSLVGVLLADARNGVRGNDDITDSFPIKDNADFVASVEAF